jgi:N-acyl homoserine lactone hydrolase
MAQETQVRRLYLFLLGITTIPTPNGPLVMSNGSYLLQLDDGRHVLIDTGTPDGYAPPGPKPEREKNVVEHLREIGLTPDDIDILICTHFDIDHAGHHDAFTKAELIVQRSHYELAKSGVERYAPARPHWDHPALRYRQVEGDVELLPGIELIETSGHAPGHQSVLVRLPQTGPVLLVIDAVMLARLFTVDRVPWPGDDNAEQLRASTRKLLDRVEREQVALTVFNHDGLQWQTLRTSPEFYE